MCTKPSSSTTAVTGMTTDGSRMEWLKWIHIPSARHGVGEGLYDIGGVGRSLLLLQGLGNRAHSRVPNPGAGVGADVPHRPGVTLVSTTVLYVVLSSTGQRITAGR
jgi:hypothetical protein